MDKVYESWFPFFRGGRRGLIILLILILIFWWGFLPLEEEN